jgi:cysteine desulfurase
MIYLDHNATTAMGLDADRALGAVRLGLGYGTTTAETDAAAAALAAATAGEEVRA